MAEALRTRVTTWCMGWVTYQFGQPSASLAELFGIAIDIVHRRHTSNEVRDCPGHTKFIPAMHEVMLDDNDARSYLSFYFSAMGIPTEAQSEIIRKIIFKYRRTNTIASNLRTTERDFLVINFKIIRHTWVLYNESEAAAWAIEESMRADTLRPIPAAKSSIDALEEVKLDCSSDSTDHCVICLETLDLGNQVKRLPCSHSFHGDCIIKWLETSHLCPLCRFEMPIEKPL